MIYEHKKTCGMYQDELTWLLISGILDFVITLSKCYIFAIEISKLDFDH